MVLRIRLARWGCTHTPFYRIVLASPLKARDAMPKEWLGTYNPISEGGYKMISLNAERIKYWLSVGAEPTERMEKLLSLCGMIPEKPMLKVSPEQKKEFEAIKKQRALDRLEKRKQK